MKKSLLFASLALAACIASAGSMSAVSQSPAVSKHEPPSVKSVLASADGGYQKANLRCLSQDPCTGVENKVFLSASASIPTLWINGGSGDIRSDSGSQNLHPNNSTKKSGQFIGGKYLVGANFTSIRGQRTYM